MTLCQHRSFRVLAVVFCSIGVLGIADGTATTWTLLILAALLSAALMPALLTGPAMVPAKVQPHVEVAR
jgi:hypothetical protein